MLSRHYGIQVREVVRLPDEFTGFYCSVMDGLTDEVVHKYRCEIIFDDWGDLTEALRMINKFSPSGIVASAEHGGPIMPHFRNGKWHVTIAI